jgi:hypothetical protein
VDGRSAFLRGFGRRAFRRPLEAAELAGLAKLYDDPFGDGAPPPDDAAPRVRAVIEAVLQAPRFLYRVERGVDLVDRPGIVRLTDLELATRLSYLVTSAGPDVALLDAAERGGLAGEGLAAELERLLRSQAHARAIGSFHAQWLGVDGLAGATKDAATYPTFDPKLRRAMTDELARFVEDVFVTGDRRLATLFTSRLGFVDAGLAALYGVPTPAASAPRVELPGAERAGVLTLAGFLTAHATEHRSSPVRRGVAVRARLLCQPPPPPPPEVEALPPPATEDLTTRERFALHTTKPSCAGCHRLIDPIGFGLEAYDGIGRHRTTENGRPVDTRGELADAGSVSGPFVGGPELAARLALSELVSGCFARTWLQFAIGRESDPEADGCALAAIESSFAASGGDLRALLAAIVASDAFRFGWRTP